MKYIFETLLSALFRIPPNVLIGICFGVLLISFVFDTYKAYQSFKNMVSQVHLKEPLKHKNLHYELSGFKNNEEN